MYKNIASCLMHGDKVFLISDGLVAGRCDIYQGAA